MQGNNRIGLMVIDDHPVVRHAICSFLSAQSNIEVIEEAGSVAEAMDKLQHCEPDVLVMDLMLPDGSGVDATRALNNEKPRRVVAFSAYESPDCVKAFIDAGGVGFVPKRCELETLVTTITAIASGKNSTHSIRSQDTENQTQCTQTLCHAQLLSTREKEIVGLVAQGLTSAQIADRLCVSLKTVETHRHNIFKKLSIKKSAQLVKYAIEHGITSL